MGDLLVNIYPWVKAGHVISVIAWMAGIFYLPRLFVYHAENGDGSSIDRLFQTMEYKLLRVIMNPAMIATWVFGFCLVLTPGAVDWGFIWPWTKTGSVLVLTWFHHWLAKRRKDFFAGENKISGRQYRIMNEVPTVFLIVIVVSVIVKPF